MQPAAPGRHRARVPYLIAGKTGTAQNTSRKGNVSLNPHALPIALRHQAWFIAYAPADDPKIAVAVMVEHGGFGASTAGPIARKIMDAWLLGKMPEPEVNPDVVTAHPRETRTPAAEAAAGNRTPPAAMTPASQAPVATR